MSELNLIEGAGQTIGPDGALKEMNDDQLKAAQKSRSEASGIAAKDSGSLTMPKKWRGKVKDSNTEWGDWTNYAFPIHDLAHANNAAARLAQNSGYSSEEKAKISKRIEAAQKKFHKEKSSFVIIDESKKFKIKKFEKVQADILVPDGDLGPSGEQADDMQADNDGDNDQDEDMEMFYTKDEVNQMMSNLYSCMAEFIQDMYSSLRNNDRNIADQMNGYINAHTEGHLPAMHPGQIKAMLTKAGIADDFTEDKPAMIQKDNSYIYASELKENSDKIKGLKFKVE